MFEKISIIIPVYNEIATIKSIVKEVEYVNVGYKKEIIIVDDGSTDGTTDFLKKLDNPGIKVLFSNRNRGKTDAIKMALEHVGGDIIIIQDADLEYLPSENYSLLLKPILRGWADVVYGSRFLGTHRVFYFWHYIGNKFLTSLTNFLYDTMLTDMETGAKVFKTEVLTNINLTSNGFGFEAEITAKVFRKGFRVYEVPIYYCGRSYEEGKKIDIKDGIKAVVLLIKYRF